MSLLLYCIFGKSMNLNKQVLRLNSTNASKIKEFSEIFGLFGYELETSSFTVSEIHADPISVIVHKASCLEEAVIADDSMLEIEGTRQFGIYTKYDLHLLPEMIGRKASWSVHLAVKKAQKVYVAKGSVLGSICPKTSGQDFGFDPYFKPEGQNFSLAQSKSSAYSARYLAAKNFIEKNWEAIRDVMTNWNGLYQKDQRK